jgi:Peptidase family M50
MDVRLATIQHAPRTTRAASPTATPQRARRGHAVLRTYYYFVLAITPIPFILGPSHNTFVAIYALVLPVFFISILMHECGHLLAGFAVGMRFRQIMVGPLLLYAPFRGRGIRLKFVPVFGRGYCAMIPPSGYYSTRRALVVLIAAGPVATLALGMYALFALAEGSGNIKHPALWDVALSCVLTIVR